MAPGAGAPFDGAHALISLARGDPAGAALAAAAMIPGAGIGATSAKLAARYGDEAAGAIGRAGEVSDAARNLVYRGLAEGDDPARGLFARAPGLQDVEPHRHVAGLRHSPWISTTRDPAIALEKYGKHGVVEIDLSRVTSQVVDFSNDIPGIRGRLSNWAKHDREVLIRDYIPPAAITRRLK